MQRRKAWIYIILLVLLVAMPAFAQESRWGYLPPNVNPAYGDEIDTMYVIIMVIVLVMFVLTEGILLLSCIIFRQRKERKVTPFREGKTIEIVWTTIPGLLLLSLAIFQGSTWTKIRTAFPRDDQAQVVQSLPRQFEWSFRYQDDGKGDKKFGTDDDLITRNRLYIPINKKVVVKLTSKDVIHSLFIPHARAKIDAVPGMMTRLWFEVNRIPCWDHLKTQKMVLLKEDEFRKAKVAMDGFVLNEEILNTSREKKFWYEKNLYIYKCSKDPMHPFSKEAGKCKKDNCDSDFEERSAYICENGKAVEKPITAVQKEAQYVLHYFDIACAEL